MIDENAILAALSSTTTAPIRTTSVALGSFLSRSRSYRVYSYHSFILTDPERDRNNADAGLIAGTSLFQHLQQQTSHADNVSD